MELKDKLLEKIQKMEADFAYKLSQNDALNANIQEKKNEFEAHSKVFEDSLNILRQDVDRLNTEKKKLSNEIESLKVHIDQMLVEKKKEENNFQLLGESKIKVSESITDLESEKKSLINERDLLVKEIEKGKSVIQNDRDSLNGERLEFARKKKNYDTQVLRLKEVWKNAFPEQELSL